MSEWIGGLVSQRKRALYFLELEHVPVFEDIHGERRYDYSKGRGVRDR